MAGGKDPLAALPPEMQPWARGVEKSLRKIGGALDVTQLGLKSAKNRVNLLSAGVNGLSKKQDEIYAIALPALIDATEFTATGELYVNSDGAVLGRVNIDITPNNLDVNGNSVSGITYKVWMRDYYEEPNGDDYSEDDPSTLPPASPPYHIVGQGVQTEYSVMGLDAGSKYQVRIETVNSSGISGGLGSAKTVETPDSYPPLIAPSKPTLASSRGVVADTWDGNLSNGKPPPPQFVAVTTQVSDSEDGPWKPAGLPITEGGHSSLIGGLQIGDTVYVRLVAIDRLGQKSLPGEAASIVVVGVELPDISKAVQKALADTASGIAWSRVVYDKPENPDSGMLWIDRNSGVASQWIGDGEPGESVSSLRVDDEIVQNLFPNASFEDVDDGVIYGITGGTQATDWFVEGGNCLQVADGETATATLAQAGHFSVTAKTAGQVLTLGGVDITATGDETIVQGDVTADDLSVVFGPGEWDCAMLVEGNYRDAWFDGNSTGAWWGTGSWQQVDLDGMVFTGAMFQTDPDEAVGVKLFDGGLIGYGEDDSGQQVPTIFVSSEDGSIYFREGIIDGNVIADGTITGNALDVGTVTASLIQAGLAGQLDLSANDSVNIVITDAVTDLQSQADDNADAIAAQQEVFSFDDTGVTIGNTGSPFELHLSEDQAQFLQDGLPVSTWSSGEMQVDQMSVATIRIGGHQWEVYEGGGTVIRALN